MAGKETFSERAEKYGVSKQAINGWLSNGRIPPRAFYEIARDLDISSDLVAEILAPAAQSPKRKWVLTVTLEESES
jgi:transcriptional regulator with XRE-family HTH domain